MEGPGATRNGRKLQAVVGRRLVRANVGNSNNNTNKVSSTGTLRSAAHGRTFTWEGLVLAEVFSIGKEVFLVLCDEALEEEVAVRLHFGMNGALVVSSNGKDPFVPPWRRKDPCSLRLEFAATRGDPGPAQIIVEARGATVTFATTPVAARAKSSRLASRDVCGPSFSEEAVFNHLHGSESTVCNAILNQDNFPGVGNIIKVEALHRANVDPRRTVRSLSDPQLLRLIRECRTFSLHWLERGRTPTKLVYNKTVCGTCGTVGVRMQKMGGEKQSQSMSRVTFWCEACQPCQGVASLHNKKEEKTDDRQGCTDSVHTIGAFLDIKGTDRVSYDLSGRRSVLGSQNTHTHEKQPALNNVIEGKPGACVSQIVNPYRKTTTKLDSNAACPTASSNCTKVQQSSRPSPPKNKIMNPYKRHHPKNHVMLGSTSRPMNSFFPATSSNDSTIEQAFHPSPQKNKIVNPYKRPRSATDAPSSTGRPTESPNHIRQSPKSNVINPYKKQQTTNNNNVTTYAPTGSAPACPDHGASSVVLRRVRKADSHHQLRIFFACQRKGCNFFAWADARFPSCDCRSGATKRKSILRVSKTERSGGKWFLCCAHGGNNNNNGGSGVHDTGCGFFAWAEQRQHLGPLGAHLTPLL